MPTVSIITKMKIKLWGEKKAKLAPNNDIGM
jgi:hypothetical protein